MDCITYLKDQNVALSWLVQEDICRKMQHSWSCYLLCCCLAQNLDNGTDCSGCSSELLHCPGETHGLPTSPIYYNFCFNKQRARDSSSVSVGSVYLLLLTPEYPVTPQYLRLLPLKKYLQIICQKSLASSQTHVFAPEVSNSSAQPTRRNCFRSLSAKTAWSDAFQRSCSFGREQSI